MSIIDFTFQGMSPSTCHGTTPVICMRNGGQNQDAVLDIDPSIQENKFW